MRQISLQSSRYAPIMLCVLRMIAGLLLLHHGTAKIFGFPHVPMFDGLQVMSLLGIAGLLELVGGTFLIIGLLTRPVAFILAGEMAFAYFMMHAQQSFFPALNGGEPAILFCFIFLYLAFAGPGSFALDHYLLHKSIAD